VNDKRRAVYQKGLRDTGWEAGHSYPGTPGADFCFLLMVHPRRGQVHWHVHAPADAQGQHDPGARFIIRIYDVTDIIFDGTNAHGFFDLSVHSFSGKYYFTIDRPGRHYLAEAGFLLPGGIFHAAVRSQARWMERDRPAGNFTVDGLFVAGGRVLPVENIFDARVFERLNLETAGSPRAGVLGVASVFSASEGDRDQIRPGLSALARHIRKFGVEQRLFDLDLAQTAATREALERELGAASDAACRDISAAHGQAPFGLIHCHGWQAAAAGRAASRQLKIPLILTLHATEHERSGNMQPSLSRFACAQEKQAAREAALVIVPRSSVRQQVTSIYGSAPEKVVIIPDVLPASDQNAAPLQADARRDFGLRQDAPVALFSGEMSHAAGADILVDAMLHVCSRHGSVQFVLAGDGPLKGELEGRVWHAGMGHRCRFTGDVNHSTFERLLTAADFLVIPARTWQDAGPAHMAISFGKPVLVTRQAGIACVVHGDNGLVTYDNPGSIIWGIQELLHNPLSRAMTKAAAKNAAGRPSLDTIAAEHCTYYEMVLKQCGGLHG